MSNVGSPKGQGAERHRDGAAAGGSRGWVSGRVKDGTKQAASFISWAVS